MLHSGPSKHRKRCSGIASAESKRYSKIMGGGKIGMIYESGNG